MITYPKIETLFNRGEDFTVDTTAVRRPEFAAVDKWLLTEKVDGTNIRLGFTRKEGVTTRELGGSVAIQIGGRTDRAELPKPLLEKLQSRSWQLRAVAEQVMDQYGIESLTLFGEGYGPRIQKGGGLYRDDQDFILFDVNVNDKSWLNEEEITNTATQFGLDRVPFLVQEPVTAEMAVSIVKLGHTALPTAVYKSLVAESNGKSSDFEIEGVVARPLAPLYDGRGQRVMWKLKGSDFRAGKR